MEYNKRCRMWGLISCVYAGVMSGIAMHAPNPFNIAFWLFPAVCGYAAYLFFRLPRTRGKTNE